MLAGANPLAKALNNNNDINGKIYREAYDYMIIYNKTIHTKSAITHTKVKGETNSSVLSHNHCAICSSYVQL